MELRDYQQEAVEAILDANGRGVRKMLLALPTGGGKTVVFASLVNRRIVSGGRALVLAHRDRLISQAAEKIGKFVPLPEIGIVMAESNRLHARCVVASVQTLARQRRLDVMPKFDLVIVDECFPAGTLVDGRPIDQIKVGDFVTCYDHSLQQIQRKRVVYTMRKPVSYLVEIRLSNGERLVCTWNHPVYVTSNGKTSYIAAALIRRGDYIHKSKGQAEDLCGLRDSVPAEKLELQDDSSMLKGMRQETLPGAAQNRGDELRLVWRGSSMLGQARIGSGAPGQGLLLGGLPAETEKPQSQHSAIRLQPQACFGEDEEKQSDEAARSPGQNISHVKRANLSLPRRQWSIDRASEETSRSARLANGSRDCDRAGQRALSVAATPLQGRHWERGFEARDRGGRQQPSDPQVEVLGSSQDGNLERVRVDGVEVLEPGSDATYGGLCPDGYVYNLEVEDHHNYFAGGILVHNCHRSAAKTYQRILAHVCNSDTLLLGVTATPSRSDGIGLDKVYDEIVYQVGILDLIERGYLAPLRGQRVTIEADFSKLHTKTDTDGINDYRQDEVCELMDKANWYVKASEGWLKYAADRRTIAFVPRVAMAHRLAEHLRGQGIRATALDGTTPQHVQRRALAEFERGEIQFLSSCDLLTEGVDLPSANCALFARPTKSQIVYSQAIGRITRLSPETGKTDGLVLDMVGATNKFDLVTLGGLFGLRKLQDGEDVSAAVKREKKEDEEAAAEQLELPELAEGRVVGREVNLFGGRQIQKRGIFEWQIDAGAKRSKLHAGGHTFEIWRENGSGWYGFADMHWRGKLNGRTTNYLEARARIEEEARRLLFGDKDAPWRSAPASPKQIELLTRFRVPIRADITKGEASDLLDAKFKKARAA